MPKQIACPRCRAQMDVTTLPAGFVVRCEGCNASLKVPGAEGPATVSPAPAPAPAAVRPERSTTQFRRMQSARPGIAPDARAPRRAAFSRKRSPTPMILGIGFVLLTMVVVLVVVMTRPQPQPPTTSPPLVQTKSDPTPLPPLPARPAEGPPHQPPPVEAPSSHPPAARPAEKKAPFDIPADFERGADGASPRFGAVPVEELGLDPKLIEETAARLSKGEVTALLQEDAKYVGAVIANMVSDDRETAFQAFTFMHGFCEKRKLTTEQGSKNPIELSYFNAMEYRASAFGEWTRWYRDNAKKLQPGGTEGAVVIDPDRENWHKIVRDLKAAGAYDDPSTPQGAAFQRLKSMGRAAYPYLVKHIDDEDPAIGRAAVAALIELTGRKTDLPREDTKARIKEDWEKWVREN